MFTVEHERNINQNLLVLYDESVKEKSFIEKMLVQNSIKGLLKIRTRTLNHKVQYCYDITKLQSLDLITERASMKKDELIEFIKELFCIIQSGNNYLLEENDFVLLPEYIFFHISTQKIKLCYFPKYGRDLKVQLNDLFEYLMNRINYKEQDAVVFLYQLYMKNKEQESSFSDLTELLSEERINKKQENFKAEEEGIKEKNIKKDIKEELILKESSPNLKEKRLQELKRKEDRILNNNETEQKEKQEIEWEREHNKSIKNNEYDRTEREEEIKNQEIKNQETKGKFVNKQKAEFFGMQEKFENEVEELYYPIICYLKMAGIVVLSFAAFAVMIYFKIIYNSLGTELDITKCAVAVTIIGATIFFVYRTTFSPENKYIRMKRIVSYAPLNSEQKTQENKKDEKKEEKAFLKYKEKALKKQTKRFKEKQTEKKKYENSMFEVQNKGKQEKEEQAKEEKNKNQKKLEYEQTILEESKLKETSRLKNYTSDFKSSSFDTIDIGSKDKRENSKKDNDKKDNYKKGNVIINENELNKMISNKDCLDKKDFTYDRKKLDVEKEVNEENFINLVSSKNAIDKENIIDSRNFFNNKVILNHNSAEINAKKIINTNEVISCEEIEKINAIKQINHIDKTKNMNKIGDINKVGNINEIKDITEIEDENEIRNINRINNIQQENTIEYEEMNNETIVLYEEEDVQETILLKLFPIDFYIYQTICITACPFFIGKLKTQMDLCIERPTVSRFHSKITKEEEKFLIYDLNTTNGTFLNGVRIPPNGNMELHDKDTISFADVSYRVEIY